MIIYTIGHSTRTLEEHLALLKENRIERLADIRRYPGSRRYPQFSGDSLERSMPLAGIDYRHIEELGGRRTPRVDSPNTGWRNAQFRAYADHMATDEFKWAIDAVLASPAITVVMCAEALPWRCHRQLVADEIVRRGHEVWHIIHAGSVQRHELNSMAIIEGDQLIYRSRGQELLPFASYNRTLSKDTPK